LSDGENQAPGSEKPLAISQLHHYSRYLPQSSLWLVLLDTSGSLVARGALARAKGVVADLCYQAYLARQPLELIGFGSGKIFTVLAARKPPRDIGPLLDGIGAGGGTPLRNALLHISTRLKQLSRQSPDRARRLFIFTDARSRDKVHDISVDCDTMVLDTEQSAVRIGKARALAKILNAGYRHIDSLPLR
jgi:magnesium chelatase subunit D